MNKTLQPFILPLSALCLSFAFAPSGPAAPPRSASTPATKPAIRVVDCDQAVQSRKRGVAANKLGAADFRALSKGVSWWYNWHFETKDAPPKDAPMEFLPMVWGADAERLAGLKRYLAAGHKPRAVLALNEPNLRDQAFVTPQVAAGAYAKVKNVADRYKIPVSGPQMSIGSAAKDSIVALDPIENKEVTYTYMVPYVKAFLRFADDAKTDVGPIGIHPYENNPGGLKALTEIAHREFKRPVWVTEYANFDASQDMNAIRTFLIQTTDFLERTDYVQGYAFFKERALDNPKISLLAKEPGALSPLGEAYVNLPVHDTDVYYRVPGRLQAEKYVRLFDMEIYPTPNAETGFTQMTAQKPNAYLDYNIFVAKAGKYTLGFRVAGNAGKYTVSKNGRTVASLDAAPGAGEYATATVTATLPAGAQTLRVVCENAGQTVNWIGFTASR